MTDLYLAVSPSMPNFSLATALDVLSSGSYSRLPSCIRERTVPPAPLSAPEQQEAFSLIECALRRRLLQESIPEPMRVTSICEWPQGPASLTWERG